MVGFFLSGVFFQTPDPPVL